MRAHQIQDHRRAVDGLATSKDTAEWHHIIDMGEVHSGGQMEFFGRVARRGGGGRIEVILEDGNRSWSLTEDLSIRWLPRAY